MHETPRSITDLGDFISASPSPFHAVAESARRLRAAGFTQIDERSPWPEAPGRHYVVRDGALIANSTEHGRPSDGFRLIGAHTDSPNLRIRPRPDLHRVGFAQLAVEVYGGVMLNSWLDRDLGLSGRISVLGRDGQIETPLLAIDEPLLRIPQLAIQLDRSLSTDGLRLNPQTQMTPIWGVEAGLSFREFLADALGTDASAILAWDLMAHDLTPPAVSGVDRSMFAAPRIDNLLSCHAAVEALVATVSEPGTPQGPVPVICLFDHEEVGSETTAGAAGPMLEATLERISLAHGLDRDQHLAALAASLCISADGAHATHPNHAERHEPNHTIAIHGGPVLKHNANMRYASDSIGVAMILAAARTIDAPLQHFTSRGDSPCGSTIGPITASRLGVRTVDLGVAQLSMHAAREVCGVEDPPILRSLLTELLRGADSGR